MSRSFLDHHQGAMFFLAKVIFQHSQCYVRSTRRTPSQLHSQEHISTQHDMLPQHPVYKNELNCECYNITLAWKNIAP